MKNRRSYERAAEMSYVYWTVIATEPYKPKQFNLPSGRKIFRWALEKSELSC